MPCAIRPSGEPFSSGHRLGSITSSTIWPPSLSPSPFRRGAFNIRSKGCQRKEGTTALGCKVADEDRSLKMPNAKRWGRICYVVSFPARCRLVTLRPLWGCCCHGGSEIAKMAEEQRGELDSLFESDSLQASPGADIIIWLVSERNSEIDVACACAPHQLSV